MQNDVILRKSQKIQFSISIFFVYTQLNVEKVLFQTVQFSERTAFCLPIIFMSKQFYFKQFSLA